MYELREVRMMFTKGDNTMQSRAQTRQTDRQPQGQPQGTRPRRGLGSWIRRGLVWTIAVLLTLAVFGAIYQAIATEIDQRTYSPPGELVDVGNHSLHINCVGEGSPTVILEAANLGMSAHWVRVQQQLAQTTRVCAYDRAGLGWSEAGPEPRDARQISSELHTLLTNAASTEGPYVLVGHSYGGLYARMYAARYSDETAGVVLVDSSHPEQFTRSQEGRAMYEQNRRMGAVLPFVTRLGATRLTNSYAAHPDLPSQQQAQIEAFNSSTQQVVTTVEEFRATPETNAQVRSMGSLGEKPLAIISAGEQSPDWFEMQDELAALSPNSIHRVVEEATHESLLYDEHDSQVTSATIKEVVEAVRTDRPLSR
jgi:pimeloyl-ACP methyl ester carboxylesterase